MTARDLSGQSRSFLATGEDFRFVKDLQARNMIVPVVGDFGGPTAMRRVGDYVRGHSTAVRAFYGSNVGVYLNLAQTRAFCASLAALPAATGAWYIERDGVRLLSAKKAGCESTTADGSARKPR
jgi:L-alanine-DL-glutamate epimerase-like enolase superfamily enzyme